MSDELVALELGRVLVRGDPDEVIHHPAVVEGYLGSSEDVIKRSGRAAPRAAKNGGRKRTAKPSACQTMTKRTLRIAGAVAILLASAYAPRASAAGAAITQVGWWTQRPAAGELPPGGFEVSLSPAGPISEAALRIRVDAVQLTTALLELTESQAAGGEVASVVACPTSDGWTPANPGAWGDAPEPNCTTSEPLSRRLDGKWIGDIASC